MLRLLVVLLLLLPVPAIAGEWIDLDRPYAEGGTALTPEERITTNNGGRPYNGMTAFSSTDLVTCKGEQFLLMFGGGHKGGGHDILSKFSPSTGEWKRLWGPTVYSLETYPGITDKSGNPIHVKRDYNLDGIQEGPTGGHTYDLGEVVEVNGECWFLLMAYGSYPGTISANPGMNYEAVHSNMWAFNLDTGTWHDNFRNGPNAMPSSSHVHRSWVEPSHPDWIFVQNYLGTYRVQPGTWEWSLIGPKRTSYSSAEYWPGVGAVSIGSPRDDGMTDKPNGNTWVIKVSEDGNIATQTRLHTVVHDETVANKRLPFQPNSAGWDYFPPCKCAIATMGDGRVWRGDFEDDGMLHWRIIHGEGDWVEGEPYPHDRWAKETIMMDDFDYDPVTGMMFGNLHNPFEGPFYFKPMLGEVVVDPDPLPIPHDEEPNPDPPVDPDPAPTPVGNECSITINGVTAKFNCDVVGSNTPPPSTDPVDPWPIRADPVLLINGGTVKDKSFNQVYGGKGAITVSANSTEPVYVSNVLGINLRNSSKNGALIRNQGTGPLYVDHAIVRDSQAGIMGCEGGDVIISNSEFERVGNDLRGGTAHPIYTRRCTNLELHNVTMKDLSGGNFIQTGGSGKIKDSVFDGTTGNCSYFLKAIDGGDWLVEGTAILHGAGCTPHNKNVFFFGSDGTLTIRNSAITCDDGHKLLQTNFNVTLVIEDSTITNCKMPDGI